MLSCGYPVFKSQLALTHNDENTLALGQSLAYTLARKANGAVFISWNRIQNLKSMPYFLPKKTAFKDSLLNFYKALLRKC